MNIIYSQKLDEVLVKATELDNMFTTLATGINTTKLNTANVETGSFDYRTLKYPPKIKLSRRFGYPAALTFSAAFSSYFAILESVLSHDSSHTTATDRGVAGRPVVQVRSKVYLGDVKISALDATRLVNVQNLCIGTSSDGGVTWTPRTTTVRPTGEGCGRATRNYNTNNQLHYMDASANYYPFNLNFERGVQLIASFGGDVENGSLAGINRFCVMVDSTTVNASAGGVGNLFGAIFLSARERGF